MKVDRDWHSKRRGMAGIVASVFMFAMLFTVGASYFLFVNQNNLLYSQAATARATALSGQHSEDLLIVGAADPSTGALSFTVQNVGEATATITGFFVLGSSGSVLAFCQAGTGGSCPSLPISVNLGTTSGDVATGVTYTSPNTYTISAVTQLGNVFSATYPPTATSLASQALSSGALGDLYLSFNSYTFYVESSSGCPTGTGYSSSCLMTSAGNTGAAFAIDHSVTSSAYGFSITVKNLNPAYKDIILDQYTLLYESFFNGPTHVNDLPWYIASVGTESGGLIPVMSAYTPVVLQYNIPVTLYFLSTNCITYSSGGPPNGSSCGSFSPTSAQAYHYSAGTVATIFILSNGWEYSPGTYTISGLSYQSANYGQNSPYVSTLFY